LTVSARRDRRFQQRLGGIDTAGELDLLDRDRESETFWGRQRSPGRAVFAVAGNWLALSFLQSAVSGPARRH
jgi:hypothetical protein